MSGSRPSAPASSPPPPGGGRDPSSRPADNDVTLREVLLFFAQRIFLYFSLYVLSIGPLYWQWYKSRFVGGSPMIAAFYEPLVILARWFPPFGAWLDWYVDLWIS